MDMDSVTLSEELPESIAAKQEHDVHDSFTIIQELVEESNQQLLDAFAVTEEESDSNKQIISKIEANEEPMSSESAPPAKRRRKKSEVWEHFKIEPVADGCSRARCNLCSQTFAYSNGSKISGTSHLKRHISMGSCPKIKNQENKSFLLSGEKTDAPNTDAPKRRYRKSWLSTHIHQERSSVCLAKMIMMHEYPIHIVEHPAFIAFARSLQPQFKILDARNMEEEILTIYLREKENLMQVFGALSGRVSLAISLWTTSQTLAYICIDGQFVDNDWKLQRRILNFMMVSSPHSENALSEAISICLSDWNMKDKLFTITLDNNCSSHDIYSANLRDHLCNKNNLILKGQIFVVRCFSHILNVAAHDLIASIHDVIYNIRESLKFLNSLSHEEFAEIAVKFAIPFSNVLLLDVPAQWNTTYLMLSEALKYSKAFSHLETIRADYNESPSLDEWRKVDVVCSHLKLLYDSANMIMGTIEPTANIFFQESWKISLELANGVLSDDAVISSTAKVIYEKFDKYWKDCSLVLSLAVIMDPRFKMKMVEFSFAKIYGSDASRYVKLVENSLHDLYVDYLTHPMPSTPDYADDRGEANYINGNENNQPTTPNSASNGLLDFDMYISDLAENLTTKSELDQYLEENLVPRIQEFDILSWWKLNTLKYPTLSRMARDILAIPVCVNTTGSIFSSGTSTRVLDEYRSSLKPEIVEALFCGKDWLQYLPTMEEPPLMNGIVKTEF